MTHYERIKNMTIEEMTLLLETDDVLLAPCNAKYCIHFKEDGVCTIDKEIECKKATRKWLESEVAT